VRDLHPRFGSSPKKGSQQGEIRATLPRGILRAENYSQQQQSSNDQIGAVVPQPTASDSRDLLQSAAAQICFEPTTAPITRRILNLPRRLLTQLVGPLY